MNRNRSMLSAAERNLGHWHGVVDAHLNARGQARQDMARSAPMTYWTSPLSPGITEAMNTRSELYGAARLRFVGVEEAAFERGIDLPELSERPATSLSWASS